MNGPLSTNDQYLKLRGEAEQDLDEVLTLLVRCEEEYCPDYTDDFVDGLMLLMFIGYPEVHDDLMTCYDQGRPESECQAIWQECTNISEPTFRKAIDAKRKQMGKEPLINYDGGLYMDPFWFEGAGSIWRKVKHHSKSTSITDCTKLLNEAEQCLADKSRPAELCFRLHQHAMICAPGLNCEYLREPMLKCMALGEKGVDYNIVNTCFHSIHNFQPCQAANTPFNANLPDSSDILSFNKQHV